MRRLSAALGAALAVSGPAAAHDGHAHDIGWTWSLEIVVPLAALLAVYLAGLVRLSRRSERGHAPLAAGAARFIAGWVILSGALISPLHEGGEVSFTLHMIEHELIMLPAALLLVAARPGPVLLWGLPRKLRTSTAEIVRWPLWRAAASPIAATTLQSAMLIVWHVPALFDRALRSEVWHIAQHFSFVGTALIFWWAMLGHGHGRGGRFVAALCLFATSVIGGGLGALMALDTSPWYAGYAALGMTPLGLLPAEDQQLAGLIMWIPGGLFHLAAALAFLAAALAPERFDHRVRRRGHAT